MTTASSDKLSRAIAVEKQQVVEVQVEKQPVDPPADTRRLEELVELVHAYNDVTERLQASHEHLTNEVARLQTELASANSALQRSKRLTALGEMAAGIAHEIRNPLTSIQLYAKMLVDDLQAMPPQRELADKISQGVRGLNNIVNDVLAVSREVSVKAENSCVAELFEHAVETMKPLIEERAVRVTIDCDDALVVYHDPELMHRVLVNLIRNSVEAVARGGQITVLGRRDGQFVKLTVKDNGPGISDKDIDRIFNPFFTTRHTGTGLGLAIVHRIIEAHSGSIAVHNNQGAVFTILLPDQYLTTPHGTISEATDDE